MNPRHVFVRIARKEDASDFVKWVLANKGNAFNSRIIPQTIVLCAFNRKRKILFMPVQRPFMLESIAPNPDATDLEKAIAMKEIVQAVVFEAFKSGVDEIYFLSSEPLAAEFASQHGFEKLDFPVYRLNIKDLEPNANDN